MTVRGALEAGFDESQAEAVVDAVGNAMGEGELVTKSDLDAGLKELESRMTLEVHVDDDRFNIYNYCSAVAGYRYHVAEHRLN